MKMWWWLAINGCSCRAARIPMPADNLRVFPVPQDLIGFETIDEQLEAEKFILTATITEVEEFLNSLSPLIHSGHISYVRPNNPMPAAKSQTHKPILWRATKDDTLEDIEWVNRC